MLADTQYCILGSMGGISDNGIGTSPASSCLPVFLQYHSAPAAYDTVLKHLNSAFTVLFSMECMLKIMAFGIVVRPG